MTTIAIGIIAGRVILTLTEGNEVNIAEMTITEAENVTETLDRAIFAAREGASMARSWRGFMAGFDE